MCSRRTPKYASMPAPANRARTRSRRPGRAARSASSQRRRSASVGGAAKSAATGQPAPAPTHGLQPVLLDVGLVLLEGLGEGRACRSPSPLPGSTCTCRWCPGAERRRWRSAVGVRIGPGGRPSTCTCCSPASSGGSGSSREAALVGRPELVLLPVREVELVELERVVRVEDRRVGSRILFVATSGSVEPVLVDAGDQWLLFVELRLALDDRGERQDLVEVQPALRRAPSASPRRPRRRTHRASCGPALRASCQAARRYVPGHRNPSSEAPSGASSRTLLQPRIVGDAARPAAPSRARRTRAGPSGARRGSGAWP